MSSSSLWFPAAVDLLPLPPIGKEEDRGTKKPREGRRKDEYRDFEKVVEVFEDLERCFRDAGTEASVQNRTEQCRSERSQKARPHNSPMRHYKTGDSKTQ